jgi:diguanylate cyclase (GGDEF)-like protein
MMKEKILLVDDEFYNLEILRIFLGSLNYELIEAMNGAEALTMAKKYSPDLILLDIMMPDFSGYEVCKQLKQIEGFNIPIIFLSAKAQKEDALLGLQLGALDYIVKPFDLDLLEKKITITLEQRKKIKWLEQDNEKLSSMAYRDGLTGLFNRTYLNSIIENENKVWKYKTILMIDIDNFKFVNDTFGHLIGDEVLKQLSSILSKNIDSDHNIAFRFGGDEFVVFLTTEVDKSSDIVNLIKEQVQLIYVKNELKITVSIGISAFQKERSFHSQLFKADQALQTSKNCGKNQISYY